ncbi:hypothetical protein KFE96_00580 [Kordiimonas sp. SCSIO 12603]|uniref:aKG-HExxH-type peptide beta-hydroxylase n=1 Tax=Kordiimonas sp. SCSIO 12603 TaxID=2829596 RepID=UPI0021081668|nr:HEXXH motif-containing putative peptide modification protein [Kordiimonas sp. SCSIO 12603]UTW58838.1 hypothetical protein KFE96_00580 [Kordiimonas sp. SCSIO 12603]
MTSVDINLLLPFSRASLANDDQVFADLCSIYVGAIYERLQEAISKTTYEFAYLADPLVSELVDSIGTKGWSPEFGHVNKLLRREEPSILSACTQFFLVLVSHGYSGEMEIELPIQDTLYFNKYRMNCHGKLLLKAGDGTLNLRSADYNYDFEKKGSLWTCPEIPDDKFVIIDEKKIYVSTGYEIDPELLYYSEQALSYADAPAALSRLQEAFNCISNSSKDYRNWTKRLLHHVGLVAPVQNCNLVSKSLPSRPGAILATSPIGVTDLAEQLVHECSHQYYHLAALMIDFVREGEDASFYSPLMKRERSIERILVGFHAFANVFLFFDEMLEKKSEYEQVVLERMKDLAPANWQLVSTLIENSFRLTDQANALWHPLEKDLLDLYRKYELPQEVDVSKVTWGIPT